MWIFEREKVWEALCDLIDKYRETIRRDEELLKIIQEQRSQIFDLQEEVESIKDQLNKRKKK